MDDEWRDEEDGMRHGCLVRSDVSSRVTFTSFFSGLFCCVQIRGENEIALLSYISSSMLEMHEGSGI